MYSTLDNFLSNHPDGQMSTVKLIVPDGLLITGNIGGIDVISFVFMDDCTGLLVAGRGTTDVLSSDFKDYLIFKLLH